MVYERTRLIEQRFQKAIILISTNHMNAKQLALELGVSQPTIQRIITELKKRGYAIRSVHDGSGWRYEIMGEPKPSDSHK